MVLEKLSPGPKSMLPEEFTAEIERERIRADRTGGRFSLVIFGITLGRGSDQRLIKELELRARSTDSIGRLDTGELAALLPETTKDGADAFARQVCEVAAVSPGSYSLTTYPTGEAHEGLSAGESDRSRRKDVGSPGDSLLLAPIAPWKRFLDLIGATVMLVITSPVMLIVALVVKVGSRGPVIFKQLRIGYAGRPFTMWKFRTMRVDTSPRSHSDYIHGLIGTPQPMVKIDDDLPLIPLGKLLRKTYLDELPQLVNVLRGEMSLVGPRPSISYEEQDYLRWHRERLRARPGMTGLWQVSGKNRLTFDQMVRLDIRYSRRPSLWMDALILVKTLPLVLIESGMRLLSSVKEDDNQC